MAKKYTMHSQLDYNELNSIIDMGSKKKVGVQHSSYQLPGSLKFSSSSISLILRFPTMRFQEITTGYELALRK